MVNIETYYNISTIAKQYKATIVAVSKTKPIEDIKALYNLGHRDFGENYVQELLTKQSQLPSDIHWHFIGHLQTNKVKQIIPFIHLIHSVDSYKLLQEINKQAQKINKTVNCLLQIHIAQEETKFGLDETELEKLINNIQTSPLSNVFIKGFMGMASFSNNEQQVRQEFQQLKQLFDQYKPYTIKNYDLNILSMGMSSDYTIAIEEGSNMIRIGSLLFGERAPQKQKPL